MVTGGRGGEGVLAALNVQLLLRLHAELKVELQQRYVMRAWPGSPSLHGGKTSAFGAFFVRSHLTAPAG